MMKKMVSMLLVLGMAAGLLTGCGGGDGADADKGASANAGGTENAGDGQEADSGQGDSGASTSEGVTEIVMERITYGFDDPDLKMVEDAINEKTEGAIGVHVTFLDVPIAEMATKLGLLVSGGDQIDIVCTGLLTTPANLAAEGLILPITQYVKDSETLSRISEGVIDACTVNDEIYAIPGQTANGNKITFNYDADLAEQYNIQLPEKLVSAEDWDALFTQVKNSGMEQYAISLGDGIAADQNWCVFDGLGDDTYASYGVVMDMVNGTTVENYYATDAFKEKCKMHRDWYEKGYAVPDSISNGYSTTDSMTQGAIFGFVSNGGVGMSSGYWAKITGKNIASIECISDGVFTKTGNVTNFSWGLASTCQNPEKAIALLELIYDDADLANMFNYGIEGVHYVTNEGSQIIDYPEGVDPNSCGFGAFIGSYGDNLKLYQRRPLTDDFIAEIPEYMYPNGIISKFMGYNFDPSSVQAEVTAVTAVIGQYGPALDCGTVDPDQTIPEFLDALEAAGMGKIIEENQKQLDAWLAQR